MQKNQEILMGGFRDRFRTRHKMPKLVSKDFPQAAWTGPYPTAAKT